MQPVVYRTLTKTSDEWLSRIHSILWRIDRSFAADGGLPVTDGRCEDNALKDPFSRCEKCKNLENRLSGRWQDTIGLQHQDGKNFALGVADAWWNAVDGQNHLAGRWGVRHQWQRESQEPEKQHEAQHETQQRLEQLGNTSSCLWCCSLRSQSQFSVCHTHFLHIAHWTRCSSVCLIPSHGHRHACMIWAFSLTSLTFSSTSSSFSHSSLTSSSSCYPSTSPKFSSKITHVHSLQRKWGLMTSPFSHTCVIIGRIVLISAPESASASTNQGQSAV